MHKIYLILNKEISFLSCCDKYLILSKNLLKRLEIQVIIWLLIWIFLWVFSPEITSNIEWAWVLFMKLLKSLLWPLLFFSVIVAILWLWDFKKLWSIWSKTFLYYTLTTTAAISMSLILMNLFKPWVWKVYEFEQWFNSAAVEKLSFWWFLENLIPDNIIESFVNLNAMQIVTMWIILWIFILATKKKSQISAVETVSKGINDWILKFIEFIIKLTPIWVLSIVAVVVQRNWLSAIIDLLPFVLVILLSLFVHAFITLPILWYFIWKFNPFEYFLKVKEAVLVWFSTASSSATMWLSMNVAKNKAMLNEEVVNFTFPIWTTVNMDWTALYQAWVAIFVAQILWIDLSLLQQLTVVAIVILASVWAAGIPWAWILILTTVFISIWLPIEAIWIILAVDRILDMFRTWVNVWWDLLTAKIVNTFYEKEKTLMEKVRW